jgi:hypothetical protein
MIKTQGNVPADEKPSGNYRGRAKINHEQMPLRFPAGTLARLDAILKENETRTDLVRECVESVIVSRERILLRQRQAAEAQARREEEEREAERQRAADAEARAAAEKKAIAKAKRDAKKAQKRTMSEAAE